jgi:uncharacterized membrane protein YphA (DoxX/SURF4 family)
MLRKFKSAELIIEVITLLFIILFVYAGLSKLMDYQKFSVQLGKSPLLTNFAEWIAWLIPLIEILVSIMLAIQRWRSLALYASFTLMVLFTTYIIAILNFSSYIPCSCGGILQGMTWKTHLWFNITFILLGFLGILLQSAMHLKDLNKQD